jgi:alpha-galactosidase
LKIHLHAEISDIAFFKWDYNRNWSEAGWDAVAIDEQKEIYVKSVDNLYSIIREVRAKHPKVDIESCSGGGGRVDLGILGVTDEVWPSYNTDPSTDLPFKMASPTRTRRTS